MAISARHLRVGESTFDLGAHTVVIGTVAWASLETRLAAVEDAGVDVVLITSVPSEDAALASAVESARSRTRLPVAVEVRTAAGVSIALSAGAGGVSARGVAVDTAYRAALADGNGSLFVCATPGLAGSHVIPTLSGHGAGLASDRLAIEPGPLTARAIARFAAPVDGDDVLVLSTSERATARRHAAIALGVGRGWPVVRIDDARDPGGDDDPGGLAATVRVIRMVDAIRAAVLRRQGGDES